MIIPGTTNIMTIIVSHLVGNLSCNWDNCGYVKLTLLSVLIGVLFLPTPINMNTANQPRSSLKYTPFVFAVCTKHIIIRVEFQMFIASAVL